MRSDTQGGVLLAVAVATGNLAVTDGHLSYVRGGLRVPLLLAAAFLAVVGVVAVARGGATEQDDHGHSHAGLRIGLMLLVPVLVLYLVAPAPLGSFAAGRGGENRAALATAPAGFPPLPAARSGYVDLTFAELIGRVYVDPDSVVGEPIRLVGFVSPEPEVPGAVRLTRFGIACCAADAYPMQVVLRGLGAQPPADTWLAVEGRWAGDLHEAGGASLPVVDVTAASPVEVPTIPYEY